MKKLAVFLLVGFFAIPGVRAQREEIVRLQSDVLQLQNQIRELQKRMDERNGMIVSLLEQLNDQAAQNSRQFEDVGSVVRSESQEVRQAVDALGQELRQFGIRLEDVTNRLASLQKRVEENQMRVQTLRSAPGELGMEVEPDQAYAASYNDYLMGNYELAIAGFQDFLSNYPDSEYADNAAYYLGDSYLKQGRYDQAVQAFDQVINLYPREDKTPVAYYKKAQALENMQRMDEAIQSLKALTTLFPDSLEAGLARDELARIGVE